MEASMAKHSTTRIRR
ncbi:hypothetical protein LINPERPRIM_LOCUS20827 [Linum perenne]